MLRGLPGSGKTHLAQEILSKNKNTVRVNKDDIRKMLHFNVFNLDNEELTKMAEKSIVYEMLSEGINVIVDDTNILPKDKSNWENVAEQMYSEFEEINIETDLFKCISNDNKRHGTDKHVGRSVIIDMAMRNGMIDEEDCVIFDMDGTIADCQHRVEYARGEKKDWDKFFSLVHLDTPIKENVEILRQFVDNDIRVVIVSARSGKCREQTEKWLRDNNIPYFHLIMRNEFDRRPDVDVKRGILNKYFVDRSKILKIYDDRPSVIRMWREEGLDVVDVGNGVDF